MPMPCCPNLQALDGSHWTLGSFGLFRVTAKLGSEQIKEQPHSPKYKKKTKVPPPDCSLNCTMSIVSVRQSGRKGVLFCKGEHNQRTPKHRSSAIMNCIQMHK